MEISHGTPDPFSFCNICYSSPCDFSNNLCPDPDAKCLHCNPSRFFERLNLVFKNGLPPKSRIEKLFSVMNSSEPVTHSSENLISFFFCSSWQKNQPRIPLFPPYINADRLWSLHACNDRQYSYKQLEKLLPGSFGDFVKGFVELHCVTPVGSTFYNPEFPLARQWLPVYCPAYYVSSFMGASKYHSVPVSPNIYTLEHFFTFIEKNNPGIEANKALVESRMAISDLHLERRITDLEIVQQCLSENNGFSGKRSFFSGDVSVLLNRYRLELKLRVDHGTTLVLSSYAYARTSAYTSLYGASSTKPPFVMQFQNAVLRKQQSVPTILRNAPRPVSFEEKEVSDIAAARCLLGGLLDTDYNTDLRQLLSIALVGKLNPEVIFDFMLGNINTIPSSPVEQLLGMYFVVGGFLK